ncbi:MAG TPA: single-stranded DNA-binding protein [Solirubrobacteraceae bacterium]|nr:single-stranded DNA-binding protein [Solirubrobacteraceae bacterium]
MSGSLNRTTLIGNLGSDPETRVTQSGQRIVSFSVATTESWKDAQSGERRERTEWHRVVIFNEGLAKIAEKYLAKGAKVFVEGKLSTRKWQDQQGNDRYSTQIELSPYTGTLTFLDSRKSIDNASPGDRNGSGWDVPKGGDLDDTIPF